MEIRGKSFQAAKEKLLTAREQWTALEELQREVGITFLCPFLFYLTPPSLPPGVMTKVLARKAIVKTAKDFAITGSAACPGIKFIYIGKAEVESKIKALDELAFTRAGVRHHGIGDESRARAL